MRGLIVACVLVGCTWPSHRFRDDALAGADAAAEDAFADGAGDAPSDATDALDSGLPPPTRCKPSSVKALPCDVLPSFDGTVTLDGAGDEFCVQADGGPELPPRRFGVTDADFLAPSPAPAGLAESVEIRAGLAADGVHVFVQVQNDPSVIVDLDDLVRGDAVEIYLRGHRNLPLNGDLESDDAQVLVIAPPTATTEARASFYVHGKRATSIPASYWRARRVAGGYELEVHYPWTELLNEPSPGMVIGFDVALDVKDDPSAPTRQLRAIMHYDAVADSPACKTYGFGAADPLCDDRTWCLAKAYVP